MQASRPGIQRRAVEASKHSGRGLGTLAPSLGAMRHSTRLIVTCSGGRTPPDQYS